MTSNPRYSMLDSMDIRCARCGYENNPQFRFCGMCGAALRPPLTEDREAGVMPQSNRFPEPPVEPMPVEPLLAQLTATPSSPAEPARKTYSSEPRNEFYGPEPAHGQRTPVPVTGPSFLGLSESGDRGVEYLLEDEPHPGRKRTLLAVLLLCIAAGVWIWHWRTTGSPWLFQSSGRPAATTSSSTQQTASLPSEVAPPMANPPKLDKPMTGVGDHPLTDDSGKPEAAPPKASATAETSENHPVGSRPSADLPPEPAASKRIKSDEARPAETSSAVAPRNSGGARMSRRAGSLTGGPDPAQDSLYLQGQTYLYGGRGVRQNCALAQQNLLAAANNNNPKAQSTLGTMYATGHCVPRDVPLAYRWFARALHSDPQNVRLERDAEILWNQMTPPEKQLALKNQ